MFRPSTPLSYAVLCAISLLLTACGGNGSNSNTAATDNRQAQSNTDSAPDERLTVKDSVTDYCPGAGQTMASQITEPGFELSGPNAIASEGDFVLANDQALFAISGMGEQKTYYHYPGILVDAVAVQDCRQYSQEHFFELPLMVGKLNAVEQHRSTFRAFKAESIEVLNDGSNGEAAIIRAIGADNYYWLLELTLMGDAVLAGEPKYLSEPFDLKLVVDYILEPDSPTLKIEYNLINTRNGFNSYNIAFVLMASGEGPTLNTFSAFDVNLAGLGLQHRIPWVTTNENGNAYVYSVDTDVLTTTRIAGVDALLDANQLANTFLGQFLSPAGEDGDSRQQRFYVTVSNADEFNAVRNHVDNVPMVSEVIDTPVNITVTDSISGNPVPEARIQFQTKKQRFLEGWPWETFLTAYADDNGHFSGSVPMFKYLQDQGYRVVVSAPGRVDSVPVSFYRADQAATATQSLDISLEGEGLLAYDIRNQAGDPIPAKITLFQEGKVIDHIYSISGQGELPMAPGDYRVGVSRGFEYGVYETDLTVAAFTRTELQATLKHWVNTEGYLSYDAHVHSSPSPDSEVSKEDRIRTAVTAGLEIVVATDHEIITDLAPAVINVGAQDHIGTIIGQEVTASLPNHTIAFPLDRDPEKPRDFVPWYGLDIAGVFAAEKAAGARIRTFAHPRGDYLDIIEWDRIAGAPSANVDPVSLGLAADAALWSWDFEAMEYMNGKQKIFSSGIFEDWMSFLNHGQHIIATGASDVHDYQTPGSPRTYFRSSTDSAPDFNIDEMVESIKAGDVVVSFGAFARATLNGEAGLGDITTDQDGKVALNLMVEATPQIDMDHVRIYVNCDEVARVTMSNPLDSAVKFTGTVQVPVPLNQDAHLVLVGFGNGYLPRVFEQFEPDETPRFTTNPIFVDTDGNGSFDAPGGKNCQI